MKHKWKIDDLIKELERENALRRQVYPNLISKGKLTKRQANEQYSKIHQSIEVLQSLKRLITKLGLQIEQIDLFPNE